MITYYGCQECQKMVGKKKGLIRHMKMHKINSGDSIPEIKIIWLDKYKKECQITSTWNINNIEFFCYTKIRK